MSHFGRSGPPDIRDTYSLLVLNISFRTSGDDLFPLFDRYGKVVDIFIPRDQRSGDSRGFAFVRYKHSHEAQKAMERLDGRNVDGRNISVQFAKYGREMEKIQKGKIKRENFNWKRSRSRSPRRSRRDDEYHGNRSRDWHDQDRHRRHEKGSSRRHRSRSYSPSRSRGPDRMKGDDHSGEDDRRNPRRRSPDRRVSPRSSRDSSPRKVSRSPSPSSKSPRASVSPDKRRKSATLRDGVDQSRGRTPDLRSRSASLNSDAEDR